MELGYHAIYKVLHWARLGQNAGFRRPARSAVKAIAHPRARPQGSGEKRQAAGRNPQLARSSPSGGRIRTEVCQVFRQARLSKRRCYRPPFRSRGRPGPWEVCFGGLGPSKKNPGRRGAPLRPSLRGAGDEGDPAPRAQSSSLTASGMTLGTRDLFRVPVTPSALPFSAAPSSPKLPRSTRPFATRAFSCFFFKRVLCTRCRRGRAGRGAQPFPPRPGPPSPLVPAD